MNFLARLGFVKPRKRYEELPDDVLRIIISYLNRETRPPSLSYPPHIRRLIKHRDALFSKVHLPSVRILSNFVTRGTRNNFELKCDSKKLLFEIDKWTRYSTRKKLSRVNDLYRHISSLTKPKLSIPELVSPQNLPVFDIISKANLLASEFASHFTLDDGCLPSLSSSRVPPSLSLFTFFPHEVYKSLRKLSPTGSTERRVIGDLCMTHMIMNGFTIIPRSLFYVYKPLRDRTSSFGINIELTTSTPRYHSFPVRTSRWYSQLPDSIRTAPNIRVFKRRLENHPIIAHLAKLT
ncbi:hypothetical protein PRIPAC_80843 [Pristionchus pacificus]|uniref:Uncharacterized protein n=1 Tax=Pristionchus pacificus TaxID=54126 RepID=A0A2A6CJW9_PRIPA|nr:hypothetical protein PRIPAC_80843 [Pristionchus pacificus]|eukprot:PDM78378.1 hypothetical protein PRIPAC_30957 [Pristionchus pacificus]